MLQRDHTVKRECGMSLDYPYDVVWTSSSLQIARLARKSGMMPDLTIVGGQGNVESGDTSSGERRWTLKEMRSIDDRGRNLFRFHARDEKICFSSGPK